MRNLTHGRGTRSVALVAAFMAVSAAMSGCSLGTDPDEKPVSARVRIEGTAPGPLRLVVSTDFYEVANDVTFEVGQVIRSADTLQVTLPYDRTFDIAALGSVLVDLANLDATPADVRLRVDLDTGRSPYDRTATMSEGGSLRYVFVFIQFIL